MIDFSLWHGPHGRIKTPPVAGKQEARVRMFWGTLDQEQKGNNEVEKAEE